MADKDFVVKNGLVVGDTLTVSGVQIDLSNATSGQVLKFDGSKFAPAADSTIDEPSSYSTTVGNNTNSSYTITHNLNTRDVVVSVNDAAFPYDTIAVRSEASTANTVTLDFSASVSLSSRSVLVLSAGDLDYYTKTIGDGSNSNIVLEHNLGSRDVVVAVRSSSSPYDFVEVGSYATTSNQVTLDFSTAPGANSLVASVFLPLEGFSYSEIVGDNSNSTFEINHNLNSRNINLIIRETEYPYSFINTYWEATTADTATVLFETPPASSSVKIIAFKGLGGKSFVPTLNDISASVPATASSSGQKGDIAYDENYIYICVATNTWKRVSLSTW